MHAVIFLVPGCEAHLRPDLVLSWPDILRGSSTEWERVVAREPARWAGMSGSLASMEARRA